MIIRLILALIILTILFFGYKRLKGMQPKDRNRAILQIALYGLAIVVGFAVLTGRMHWIGALLAGLLAFARIGLTYFIRFLPFLRFFKPQTVFGEPVINTAYIKIKINLQTGHVQGEIIQGLHEGKRLENLTEQELFELESYYKDKDKKSYFLIRAIIQKAAFQQAGSDQSYAGSSIQPSVDEALQILGLPKNPTKKDIVRAHKSLMQKLHPDRGGNDYLAAQINNAKERLIKHYNF